jgi:putative two-component system response regulator
VSGRRSLIFLVDDNETSLTAGKNILKDKYRVYPALSADIMFELLENITPELILLDVEMPGVDGYQALERLRKDPARADIPVIFLTAMTDEGSELKGLSLGAIDYIYKPFAAPLLLKRIENHLLSENRKKQLMEMNDNLEELVQKRTAQIMKLKNVVLNTVANLVEFRDEVTGGHIVRTQKYLELMVRKLIETGMYAEETSTWSIDQLISSAQLHDVGKIFISDAILSKPDKLTHDEFETMKGHATAGIRAIKLIEGELTDEENDFMRYARQIAGGHHERWDGSGYPNGLKGEDIPLTARLMAIADVYDALVSARPYKRPFSAETARQMIAEESGTHFDPSLVEVFLEVADKFAEVARGGDAD